MSFTLPAAHFTLGGRKELQTKIEQDSLWNEYGGLRRAGIVCLRNRDKEEGVINDECNGIEWLSRKWTARSFP